MLGIARQFLLRAVIGNQETFKAYFFFQDFSQQHPDGRAFHSIPTAIGRHDCGNAGGGGRDVAGKVNAPETGVAQARVALVEPQVRETFPAREAGAKDCATVPGKMLGAGDDAQRVSEIRALKREHLGVDEATDVLSFPIDAREALPAGVPRQLGDAVICPQVTGEAWQAPLVHGLLHLLGYDHGPEMETREEAHAR